MINEIIKHILSFFIIHKINDPDKQKVYFEYMLAILHTAGGYCPFSITLQC
jgi:hypothetical protein